MQEPTDEEIIEYVADMAAQLAVMCGRRYPIVAAVLRTAAKAARDRIDGEPSTKLHGLTSMASSQNAGSAMPEYWPPPDMREQIERRLRAYRR